MSRHDTKHVQLRIRTWKCENEQSGVVEGRRDRERCTAAEADPLSSLNYSAEIDTSFPTAESTAGEVCR